jgi:copper chaperone CopZ
MPRLETFRLKVVGEQTIHCGGCENAIQMSLSQLPGVKRVKADHKTQLVEVSADVTQTDLQAVRERLEWMGYQIVISEQ